MTPEDQLELEWVIFNICVDLQVFFYDAMLYEPDIQQTVERQQPRPDIL